MHRSAAPATFLLAAFALSGCSDRAGPCDGVGCAGHGICVAVADTSYCWCADGFHPVGLDCVANDSTDPCRDLACSGHGTCRVSSATSLPYCDCDSGYAVFADLHCLAIEVSDAAVDTPSDDVAADAADVPAFTYEWQVGPWNDCPVRCGGGVQTRPVMCLRSDGTAVGDELCPAPKPEGERACGTEPCCSTTALANGRRCQGEARAQWFPFGANTGDAGDQASCAAECTSWAPGNALTQWCCELYEDSSPGTVWVCRIYDGHADSGTANPVFFAGLGQCS
jgi:hypothetical protein